MNFRGEDSGAYDSRYFGGDCSVPILNSFLVDSLNSGFSTLPRWEFFLRILGILVVSLW